ncbi:arabinan endo-1,5-alpha-L-arabinosidase [Stakelama saccharophila]|uniref:Extracellular exo-alpha-(1->5)-L-arabinofuranosidase n=1 Tax=Stakelama saccharophila TaxID=3075605 RepID=A0ABZ0B6T9_9SPHN|nr:arabinan endo-1,5-alpha-L-arabinosidase [Stakelama sp. W311]WNO52346.1 arabinan endo-1,5-alpha-L-arabinosidase [Stakelama sp. W311]
MLLSGCGGNNGGIGGVVSPSPAPSPTPPPIATPAPAPEALTLSGDTAPVHDPSILAGDGGYYLFTTGNRDDPEGLLAVRTSPDLRHWTYRGAVFEAIPAWAHAAVPGTHGIWAPDISRRNGEYRLYYSVSTFGKNRSAIGLATRSTLTPSDAAEGWRDRGEVIASHEGDDFNAIDPNVFEDANDRQWLVFGSFWSGIKMVRLDPATGKRLAAEPVRSLARRPQAGAIEAPYVIRHGDHYYLFASFDYCCRGADSSYYTVVGRSAEPTGPYVDRDGTPMLQGGGTIVLTSGQAEGSRYVGRGHVAIVRGDDGDYITYHAYDTQRNGLPTLRIRPIEWTTDGWPIAR